MIVAVAAFAFMANFLSSLDAEAVSTEAAFSYELTVDGTAVEVAIIPALGYVLEATSRAEITSSPLFAVTSNDATTGLGLLAIGRDSRQGDLQNSPRYRPVLKKIYLANNEIGVADIIGRTLRYRA